MKPPKNLQNRARRLVAYAIKTGKLTRQPCEVCGKGGVTQAHHDDYDYPFQIRWLCRRHHMEHHYAERGIVPQWKTPTVPLPPGVAGPRYGKYSATARDGRGKPVHLGWFDDLEMAVYALERFAERNKRPVMY